MRPVGDSPASAPGPESPPGRPLLTRDEGGPDEELALRLLAGVTWALTVLTVTASAIMSALLPPAASRWLAVAALQVVVATVVLLLARARRPRAGAVILVTALWVMGTFASWLANGLEAPAISVMALVVVTAGLLLGWRASAAAAVVCELTIGILAWAAVAGSLPEPAVEHTVLSRALMVGLYMLMTAALITLATYYQARARERATAALEERRKAEDALRARSDDLDALLRASRAITSSLDYQHVLHEVARTAGEALGAARCDVWELESPADVLVFRSLWEREHVPGFEQRLHGIRYDVRKLTGGLDGLRAGRTVLCLRSDPELSPSDAALMDELGEKTWLTVPLLSERGLLGVMTLDETERERGFSAEEERLAASIGEQAAVALDNARVHREQEERSRWLEALVEAGRTVTSRLDIDQLLDDVARLAGEALRAPAVCLYEYDAERRVAITRSRYGAPGVGRVEAPGAEYDIKESPDDLRVLEGGEVFVETISDPGLHENVRRSMESDGEKTLANVPLRFAGEPLGMLVLIETENERVFSSEELEFLRAFGEQAAVALNNARLFAALTQTEHRLEELNADLERRVERRTAQLHAANEELEAFAYSVSHDLRAPLRAVDGFSRLVLEDEGAALSPSGRADLERVRAAAQRMGLLIDDLLGLSRLSRRDLVLEPVDLSRLARDAVARLAEQDPGRHVEVRIAYGCHAVADGGLAGVVLDNLLQNAWKFTAGRDPAHVEFGETESDGEQVFFVRDDGAGFDPERAGQLFQPFHRLHRDDEYPGSGIGLATVRRAVARQGGRCWAEGAVDRGATFFFTLPAPAEDSGVGT